MPARPKTYLDSNATYPLNTAAKAAVFAFLAAENNGDFAGNPSSIHANGRLAKKYLSQAREQVAHSISCKDSEQIVFTSGGSEANQWAIRSALEGRILRKISTHWIVSSIEHDSNLQMVTWARERGVEVDLVRVKPDGTLDLEHLATLFRPTTALVSVIWVNNETGVVQDLQSISQIINHRAAFHIDAAQAWGKLQISDSLLHTSSGVQYLTFSGQKIGGLQGAGFLCLGRGIELHSTILGKQEKGRRGGTESLLPLISMGAAAQTLNPELWAQKIEPLQKHLERALLENISGITINGQSSVRVANTTSLTLQGLEHDTLVMALDIAGFSVSAGSACSSGVMEPSHVLMAMGKTKAQALSSLRISLNENNTFEELDSFVQTLKSIVGRSIGVHGHV